MKNLRLLYIYLYIYCMPERKLYKYKTSPQIYKDDRMVLQGIVIVYDERIVRV